jgi:hypothetical protein
MTEHPEVLTLAEFCRHIRRSDAWGSMLKSAGRLVLTDDGRVRVAESIALIEATAAGRDDVADRHAAARAARDAAPAEVSEAQRNARRLADLRRAEAGAALAELELRAKTDEVLSRADHLLIVDHIVTTIRESFLAMPSRLVPQLESAAGPEVWPALVEAEVRIVLEQCAESWRRRADALRVPMP